MCQGIFVAAAEEKTVTRGNNRLQITALSHSGVSSLVQKMDPSSTHNLPKCQPLPNRGVGLLFPPALGFASSGRAARRGVDG